MSPMLEAVLLGGLTVASVTDLREGKIYNWLTFPMMALALSAQAFVGDLTAGLIGLGAAFALHFVLFAAGAVKAGDAKLMMGVGAVVGWRELVEATFWELFLLIPLGLLILALRGRLANLLHVWQHTLARARGEDPGPAPQATLLVYGPVIAVAVALAHWTDWLPQPW